MSDHILALMTTQFWQITAMAIVVTVVVKLAAKNRPHLAHALWVLVLIKCVTPPLWEHSLGVFSQLQARLMPVESAFLPDATNSPPSMSVAIAETLDQAPEIDVPGSEHGQPETYEPDDLLSMADTEPPEDASLLRHGGAGIELDEAIQLPDELRANTALAESTFPVEGVESDANWLHPGWLLLSGLVAGAIMTMFVMVVRCLRCVREIHRHRTTEFDDPLRERIQQLSSQLRIRRVPQIIVSDVLFGPAVLGLLRHTIVLPRCLFETAEGSQSRSFLPERTFAAWRTARGETSAQRQSDAVESMLSGRVAASREVLPGREDLQFLDPILAHELLHIRRGDLRTGTLQAIVQSLWWFHPAVWLSNRWLSREAERCCDEQVIAELGCSPAQYARSLLSVIECKHQLQPIPVFPGMKPVEITSQRMERIMSLKNGLKKRTPLWCWLTVVGLAIVVLPGAVAKSVHIAPPIRSFTPKHESRLQVVRRSALEVNLGKRVSLNFENTNLMEVLRSLAKDHGINIACRVCNEPTTVTFQCQDEPLGETIQAIVEPFGLCMRLANETIVIEFPGPEHAMDKFRSFSGPPSYAVFGIVRNTGWQLLDKEIRLRDAIRVTQNGSAEALPATETGAGVINGKGVNNDAGLGATVRFDQPSNVDDRPGRSPAPSEIQDNVAGRYDGPPTPELIREPKLDSPHKLLVPERPMPPAIQQSSDPLVKLVWEARESSRRRLLTTDQYTPWQLMHGVLGLRQDFLMKHDGKIVNGLEWIQSGPTFKDEPPYQEDQPWFQKTKHGGRTHPYLRPYLFEGHINQFAAILASCRLPLNAQFGTPDGPITMQDLITNAQMTANEKEEVSWTLSLLSQYLPPDAKWVNAKGEEWSIERLVKVEVGKRLHGAPGGGTCGLFALAVARHEYLRSGKPLEGVWLEAEQKIQKHIALARTQQNADGTLSSNYFRGREYKQDFDKRLASSGALLQFLMMAASDEQLREDWLRRAVEATANDLMSNRKAFVSCAPLFETTNAFGIYLDRISVSAVAGVKPDSKEDSLAERLVLVSYSVADLVFREVSVVSAVSRATDSAADATHDVVPDAALTSGTAVAADQIVDVPDASPQAKAQTWKADLAPLVELIKASVDPDSWDERVTVAVEEATLSLIIRQSEAAHGEIAELLTQLRDAQDQSVLIPCRVMHLTRASQTKWLEEQCSLHSLEPGIRWALLPRQRCESFTQALLEQKPEVLSRPRMITISGQTATITVGTRAAGGTATAITGIRLEVTPHLLPNSSVIRLQHSFAIGEFTNPVPRPIESLVGSGQTLLLLIDDPEDNEKTDGTISQYLLMMTPEHIPLVEEEEAAAGKTPKES